MSILKNLAMMTVFLLTVQLVKIRHAIESNKLSQVSSADNDDRWIWGLRDEETHKMTSIPNIYSRQSRQKSGNEYNSEALEAEWGPPICDQPYPVMPNFTAPRRSVSIVKCHEYVWQQKYLEYKSRKDMECRLPLIDVSIIGGRNARPGEFPHMGSIGWKAVGETWLFKCGASLISKKWTLTAAHCTNSGSRDTRVADHIPKIIRFGDINIIEDAFSNDFYTIDRRILRIIVHHKYRSPKKYFDIALMEMAEEITFDYNVQPACLWNSFDVNSLKNLGYVYGWGVVDSGSRINSQVLQVAAVDFIDSSICDQLLRPLCNRHWCGIRHNQICAGKLSGGVDACHGDSGGPLSVRINFPKSTEGAMHHVVGVTSFSFGCAFKNIPGVFTRVSTFVPWIESYVWPTSSS